MLFSEFFEDCPGTSSWDYIASGLQVKHEAQRVSHRLPVRKSGDFRSGSGHMSEVRPHP